MLNASSQRDINSILVPTDGSECSKKAVEYAGNLAKKLSAKVHVMFVFETNYAGPWYYYILDEAASKKIEQKGKALAEETAQSLRDSGVDEVQVHIEEGHPGEVITDLVNRLNADLICHGNAWTPWP